ncbi:MAG: carbohydrate kinase family protein [Candidatus Woesebacteria bacterium]
MQNFLCVGFATVDTINGRRFPGGAAGGMSINSKKLGINSSLLAPLSSDELGLWYRKILEDRNVSLSLCEFDSPSIPTCLITDVHAAGSTRVWKDNGAVQYLETMKVPDSKVLEQFDAILFCTAIPPLSTSVSLQTPKRNLFVIPGTYCLSHPESINPSILEKTEIIFGNEEEASPIFASKPFQYGVQLIVITAGKDGGIVYSASGKETPFLAATSEAIDTTGAGDCFALGFISSWTKSHSIGKSIEAGTTLASQVIQVEGVLL